MACAWLNRNERNQILLMMIDLDEKVASRL